jgi:hypothetical protein
MIASILVSMYGWQVMVDDLGKPIGHRRGAQICLVGQLGKYMPGSAWAYVLQMELVTAARRECGTCCDAGGNLLRWGRSAHKTGSLGLGSSSAH